MSEAKETMMK